MIAAEHYPGGPQRRRFLSKFVYCAYLLFLAGFYFVPNAVDLYKYYIACVFVPGLLLLPLALREVGHSRILWCVGAYLVYMLVSSLWSEPFSAELMWQASRYVAYILVFVLLTGLFCAEGALLAQRGLQQVTWVVGIAAAVSIALFAPLLEFPPGNEARLSGIGITENPNPSAFVYGFFGLCALHFARGAAGWGPRWSYRACFVITLVYSVLTQSNTGLLAFACGCAALLLASAHRRVVMVAAGALVALFAAAYLAWSVGLMSGQMDPGFANRLPIWQHVLQQWSEAALFGNGLQQRPPLTPDAHPLSYAHSLFLSTLRDGGLVGLALLLAVFVLAVRQGLREALVGRGGLLLALCIYGLVCVLADVDQAITRPRELWIILWLPLGCLIAREAGAGDGAGVPGAK